MNKTLLCSWLGLAEHSWPPDHHALLGLQRGDSDLGVIEQRVHDCMARLRGYQIAHPEEATEGMNRIAQAFIVLMEQAAKNGSSISLPPAVAKPSKEDTAVGRQTIIDWRAAPPPVRQTAPAEEAIKEPQAAPVATVEAAPAPAPQIAPPAPQPASSLSAPPAPPPPDYLAALAQESTHATRNIGTLPLLIERVEQTRRLLVAWLRLGRYVKQPARKLASRAEEKDLSQKWNALVQHLDEYPRFVAQPGRPGYRVAAFARLEMTALMFKSMGRDQRSDLARDWEEGRKVLLLHRSFLRERFKALRHANPVKRFVRGVRSLVNDHPAWVIVGATAAAAICALLYVFVLP
jgi:hypothetical protein